MDKFKLIFSDRRMFIVFVMGFASGLPLMLTGSTLQAWFKDAGMDLTSLGLLSLIGAPYTLKFLWSPALDALVPPFLGRRRGWLLLSQIGLIAALIGMAISNPHSSAMTLAVFAFLVALMSATQDIGIDAYQLEILPTEMYGLGNQFYILGYRLGMVVAASGALILADHVPWQTVYLVMAAIMGIGVAITLFAPEPKALAIPKSFKEAVWHPLKDFLSPTGTLKGKVAWVFAFFLLYKIGGDLATQMTMPFYQDLGYSKTEIGALAKACGLWATIVGGVIGGGAIVFIGLKRSLWVFGIIQGIAILSFAWLAQHVAMTGEKGLVALGIAISIDYLAAGLGTAAYATYMGSLVNKKFTATQYAILSSLMGATRVYGAAPSGWLAGHMGWTTYFAFCSLASIPGLLVLLKLDTFSSTGPQSLEHSPEVVPKPTSSIYGNSAIEHVPLKETGDSPGRSRGKTTPPPSPRA